MEIALISGTLVSAFMVAVILAQLIFVNLFGIGLKFVDIGLTGIGRKKFDLFGDSRYPCTMVKCLFFTVYDLTPPVAFTVKKVIGAGEDVDEWIMDRATEIKEYKVWLYEEAFKEQKESSQEDYDRLYEKYEEKLEEVSRQAKDLREMRIAVEETKKLFYYW